MDVFGMTAMSPQEFRERREKVLDFIGREAVALLQGDVPTGAFDPFRQDPEFFYLSGVEVPYAYLLVDGRERKTTLYLPPADPQQERSEGPVLNSDDPQTAVQLTGVDEVKSPETLEDDIRGVRKFYIPQRRRSHQEPGPLSEHLDRRAAFLRWVQKTCLAATIEDLSPFLSSLRLIKSPAEIEQMRKAGKLTAMAVTEAMRCTRPGVMEYQLRAVADYIYLVNGAAGPGYRAIIAGGPNAWHGHYFRNDSPLRDGDLILMDYAPDCGHYTSDIGRMWPVNGKYADWQRELYGLMVEYHKALLRRIRPGALASEILEDAAAEMRSVIDSMRFSKPCYEAAARRTLEFGGHLSHPVGLEVHDGGNYRQQPLVPGIAFSIDPQMWIPEEQRYIRVEDTIVVTEDGIENFTALAPLELDDVEATMREEGLFDRAPQLQVY